MRVNLLLAIFLLIFLSCDQSNSQNRSEFYSANQTREIEDAKWYFYCYASSLKGYLSSSKEINPLECDIKVLSVDSMHRDTVRFYFDLFYKDTSNICYTKPYGLFGVTRIRNKLYYPIYHMIRFHPFDTDSASLANMEMHERMLRQRMKENTGNLSKWLESKK